MIAACLVAVFVRPITCVFGNASSWWCYCPVSGGRQTRAKLTTQMWQFSINIATDESHNHDRHRKLLWAMKQSRANNGQQWHQITESCRLSQHHRHTVRSGTLSSPSNAMSIRIHQTIRLTNEDNRHHMILVWYELRVYALDFQTHKYLSALANNHQFF